MDTNKLIEFIDTYCDDNMELKPEYKGMFPETDTSNTRLTDKRRNGDVL